MFQLLRLTTRSLPRMNIFRGFHTINHRIVISTITKDDFQARFHVEIGCHLNDPVKSLPKEVHPMAQKDIQKMVNQMTAAQVCQDSEEVFRKILQWIPLTLKSEYMITDRYIVGLDLTKNSFRFGLNEPLYSHVI